jgi:hypothetical protein
LVRGEPAEILARITAEDPLRLFELGASFLRTRFFLMEPERLHEQALLRVAVNGARAGETELDRPWVEAQIDHALNRLIDDDREEERRRPLDCDPEDGRYAFLRRGFAVVPACARAAELAFDTLPERARRGFFYLLMERRPVVECLALGIWEADELRRDVWRCLGALGYPDPKGRPDPNWNPGWKPRTKK